MKVIQLVSNKVWGGGERYALDLTTRLLEDKADVKVVTIGKEIVDKQFRKLGVKIIHAPFKGLTDFKTPGIIASLIEQFDDNEPTIIHAHDFKNALLALRAKRKLRGRREVRVIVTRHLIKRGKSDFVNQYVYRNIDELIFISNAVKEEFLSSAPTIDHQKLHTVYNSIYNPPVPALTITKGDPKENVNILFMGRLSKEKGVEMLLNSLALINDNNWKLRIGGTGDQAYVDSLKTTAETLGLTDRIEWLGHVSDIWHEINRADFGVMPSVWREPFGLTLLEFMSQGKPMVTTDNGAQKEILTDGFDSLLSSPIAEKYSEALQTMISDPAKRHVLGQNALTTFRKFNYENFYSQIKRVYLGQAL